MSRPVFWLVLTPAIVAVGFATPFVWAGLRAWSESRAVVS